MKIDNTPEEENEAENGNQSATATCSLSDTEETDRLIIRQDGTKIYVAGDQVVWADDMRKMERKKNKYLRHREEGKINGHKVAVQRDKLQDAIREMVAAKGRYNTQKAMEHLISLLPENALGQPPATGGETTTHHQP